MNAHFFFARGSIVLGGWSVWARPVPTPGVDSLECTRCEKSDSLRSLFGLQAAPLTP